MDKLTDNELFEKLKEGNENAFRVLFLKYYGPLCVFALQFLAEKGKSEEVVQEVFFRIWMKREQLHIETSVKQYFFRSVRNECLNNLQHRQVRQKYSRKVLEDLKHEPNPEPYFLEVGLQQKIEKSIHSLPEKRREIFRLSRVEGLKYHEIADRMNISVKTVEAQMGMALKQLREMLKDYKDYLLGFSVFLKKR